MYIEISKNILLVCLTICVIYLIFNKKNNIEKFTDNTLTESIKNLGIISQQIMNNGTLTIPANEVYFSGNTHFASNKSVTIDGPLSVSSLNILPRGCVIAWYGQNHPEGWVICDGTQGTPDLRGRFVLGEGHGPGLTSRTSNQIGGEENHRLTVDEMPSHSHHYYRGHNRNSGGGTADVQHVTDDTSSRNTDNTGGNIAHNNMPPYRVLTYIMKT